MLPEAFAADPDRLARFTREAKTLAALNHPHIAAIYGLEESAPSTPSTGSGQAGSGQAGITALVMELVEGDDLSQRIKKGAIPIDEALPIAKQIAEALEAAHEQGIIHRDLKPANIKVRPDGTVKVLDFGLAKAMNPPAGSSPNVSQSPTITTPAMTQAGMILGTAAYMAPEQAKGKTVDKRADIWAFGAVLFEMVTGRRVFEGEDVSDTLARVLMKEPDWTVVPATVPAAVVTVMRRCLQKDHKQRVRDIGDVSLALEGAFETAAPQPGAHERPRSRPVWRELAAWGLAIAGLVAAGVAAWRGPAVLPAPPASRFSLTLDASEAALVSSGVVSPDGQAIVISLTPAKDTRLRLRRLDAADTVPLAGTENGSFPFWSPDSRSISFVVDRTSGWHDGDFRLDTRPLTQPLPRRSGGGRARAGVEVRRSPVCVGRLVARRQVAALSRHERARPDGSPDGRVRHAGRRACGRCPQAHRRGGPGADVARREVDRIPLRRVGSLRGVRDTVPLDRAAVLSLARRRAYARVVDFGGCQ